MSDAGEFDQILEAPTASLLERWLRSRDSLQQRLHTRSADVRTSTVSDKVYFRGIIEFSNICQNDCAYCGIRNSNRDVDRYWMSQSEIMECAEFCHEASYGSLVLQSGERSDVEFVDFVEEVVGRIKDRWPEMGLTLCVGEQSEETYRRFYEAGADRYLLRIESTNPAHYDWLHTPGMRLEERKRCLRILRCTGYQVGTGVMIGAPRQSVENLARDLLFMREIDIDMVGMGPYVPHETAPVGDTEFSEEDRLDLSLNMIALLRLMLPEINIAATTALQALDPRGRERALKVGANVMMPVVTPQKYRSSYQLYANKPCVHESPGDCQNCITRRVKSAGFVPALGQRGDSLHYVHRTDHVDS